MMAVLIIDGSSLLASSYYGSLPDGLKGASDADVEAALPHAPNGVPVNAIINFMDSAMAVLSDHPEFAHIAFVFDETRLTFRRQIWSEYKANREPKPSPMERQEMHVRAILKKLGFTVLSDPDLEADDLARTVAGKFEKWGHRVTAWTRDNDWVQIAAPGNGNACVWITQMSGSAWEKESDILRTAGMETKMNGLPPRTIPYDAETAPLLTGLEAYQVPDFKGLAGCSSDNIPGVPGIGPVSAVPLLRGYGTVEALYDAVDAADGNPAAEKALCAEWKTRLRMKRPPLKKLEGHRQEALLCKNLATMRGDAKSVPNRPSGYLFKMNKDALEKVISAYGLPSLALYSDIAERN